MTRSHYRLAFLGGGRTSAVGYVHRVASQLDGRWSVSGGIFSRDPSQSHDTAEAWGIPLEGLCSDLDELTERARAGDFDAVAILTPTPEHTFALERLLAAGVPIICEKALTGSASESEQIRDLQRSSGTFLSTTLNYTGYPMVRELRERIRQGHLGRILRLDVRMPQETYLPPRNLGTGAVQDWRRSDYGLPTVSLDLGVHVVEMARFLHPSPVVEVTATAGSFGDLEVADDVQALVRFGDGSVGSFWFGKAALGNRNGLAVEIYGDEASAVWVQEQPDSFAFRRRDRTVQVVDRGTPDLVEAGKPRYVRFKAGHPTGFIEAFANLYSDIADALAVWGDPQEGADESNDFVADAAATHSGMMVLAAIARSSRERCWVDVDVSQPDVED
mgnify:CR=1 FL=1